jgi:hypothetical protein
MRARAARLPAATPVYAMGIDVALIWVGVSSKAPVVGTPFDEVDGLPDAAVVPALACGAITANRASVTCPDRWPVSTTVCSPDSRPSGTTNVIDALPAASAVTIPRSTGSECSHTCTSSPGSKPSAETVWDPPGSTVGAAAAVPVVEPAVAAEVEFEPAVEL